MKIKIKKKTGLIKPQVVNFNKTGNIIYAPNGSGKTTFFNLLSSSLGHEKNNRAKFYSFKDKKDIEIYKNIEAIEGWSSFRHHSSGNNKITTRELIQDENTKKSCLKKCIEFYTNPINLLGKINSFKNKELFFMQMHIFETETGINWKKEKSIFYKDEEWANADSIQKRNFAQIFVNKIQILKKIENEIYNIESFKRVLTNSSININKIVNFQKNKKITQISNIEKKEKLNEFINNIKEKSLGILRSKLFDFITSTEFISLIQQDKNVWRECLNYIFSDGHTQKQIIENYCFTFSETMSFLNLESLLPKNAIAELKNRYNFQDDKVTFLEMKKKYNSNISKYPDSFDGVEKIIEQALLSMNNTELEYKISATVHWGIEIEFYDKEFNGLSSGDISYLRMVINIWVAFHFFRTQKTQNNKVFFMDDAEETHDSTRIRLVIKLMNKLLIHQGVTIISLTHNWNTFKIFHDFKFHKFTIHSGKIQKWRKNNDVLDPCLDVQQIIHNKQKKSFHIWELISWQRIVLKYLDKKIISYIFKEGVFSVADFRNFNMHIKNESKEKMSLYKKAWQEIIFYIKSTPDINFLKFEKMQKNIKIINGEVSKLKTKIIGKEFLQYTKMFQKSVERRKTIKKIIKKISPKTFDDNTTTADNFYNSGGKVDSKIVWVINVIDESLHPEKFDSLHINPFLNMEDKLKEIMIKIEKISKLNFRNWKDFNELLNKKEV